MSRRRLYVVLILAALVVIIAGELSETTRGSYADTVSPATVVAFENRAKALETATPDSILLKASLRGARRLGESRRTSLVQLLQRGTKEDHTFDSFKAEFDLRQYYGVYYLASPLYDSAGTETGTVLRHASSVRGLDAAPVDQVIRGCLYPSLRFDAAVWHIFCWNTRKGISHYVSYSFGGEYVLTDTIHLNVFDPQVRLDPVDHLYYMAYTSMVPYGRIGMARAKSLWGPWTNLGLTFAHMRLSHAFKYLYDPTPIFWEGRAYVVFAFRSGHIGQIAITELDPADTMRAIGKPTVLIHGPPAFGNPIWVPQADNPAEGTLYYASGHGVRALRSGQLASGGLADAASPPTTVMRKLTAHRAPPGVMSGLSLHQSWLRRR